MADADVRDQLPPVASPVEGQRSLREVETLPSYIMEDVDVNYTAMLQKFRERSLFVDGVRKEAVSRTKPHHWLSRKQKNGTVTYNLMGPGAERLRTIAPIGFTPPRRREETWNKESGPGYTIVFEAEVYLGSQRTGYLPVMGTCSSDDDFFSTEHVELPYVVENPEHKAYLDSGEGRLTNDGKTLYVKRQIPASEVTKENIEKSALTNLIVNGVTRVLGIRSMSAAELAECGIAVDQIPGFEYGSKKDQSGRLAPAEEQKRDEIRTWLMEMAEGDEKSALSSLKTRTAFKSNDPGGRDYPGCESWDRLTPKQIAMHHEKVKADYMAWREGSPGPAKQTQKPPQGQPQKGAQRAAGDKPARSGAATGGPQQEEQQELL